MHWDQEPIRFGPRAVPAGSGRAKTRAWVIFQGCWRGSLATTGDPSRSALFPYTTLFRSGSWRKPSFVFSAWIGTMNLTTRWERGSASRSTSLHRKGLRVKARHTGTACAWRAFFRFAHALGPGTDQVRTAGGPRRQRPRKNQGVGDFPGVLARVTCYDRGPVAICTLSLHDALPIWFMEKALFRFFRMDWNHEPDNAVGARHCEPQHVATSQGSAGESQAHRDGVCMESLLSLRACIGTRNRSGSDRGRSPPAAAAQKPGRG